MAQAAIQEIAQILIPHGVPKDEVRSTKIERAVRVLSAPLPEVVAGLTKSCRAPMFNRSLHGKNAACAKST